MSLYSLARPVLFSLDAERAHDMVIGALGQRWMSAMLGLTVPRPLRHESLNQSVVGMDFANPVGLAAGLDKQGTAVRTWQVLGFGAAEIGTVTPLPQPGNPLPRLFRLPADGALINRFGFNSVGAASAAHNLTTAGRPGQMRVGVNVGKNKDTPLTRAVDDYVRAVGALHGVAEYFVINVSSPNTTGLRDLQHSHQLGTLVAEVVTAVGRSVAGQRTPVLVKLSPDMHDSDLLDAADAALAAGATGIVATNTSLARDGLRSARHLTQQAGGLSGVPLRTRSTAVCRALYRHIGNKAPIIGVGGIDSPTTAYERIRAGATLIQIYTALIYHGPLLVHTIVQGLAELLDRDGVKHIREVVGIDAH